MRAPQGKVITAMKKTSHGWFCKSKSNIMLHRVNTAQEPVPLTHALLDQLFKVNSEVNVSKICIPIQNRIEMSSPWRLSLDGDRRPRTFNQGAEPTVGAARWHHTTPEKFGGDYFYNTRAFTVLVAGTQSLVLPLVSLNLPQAPNRLPSVQF